MPTEQVPKLGEKLSPVLESLFDTLVDHKVMFPEVPIDVTDKAFLGAVQLLADVLLSRMFDLQMEEGMSLEQGGKMAKHAGESLHKLILEMTNIDTRKLTEAVLKEVN